MDSPLRTGLRYQGLPLWLNLWADALDRYKERTGINLWNATDELSQRLYAATEENDVIEILEEKLNTFNSFREGSPTKENTRKGLKAVVRAVLLFSDAIAEGASVVPGAKSILVAVGVFLKATQEVSNRFDIITELFERLGHFLRRLQAREGVPHSEGSRAITIQIFVELLNIFALTTNAMKQKRLTHYAHALLKKDKIRESLHTLDFLTSQELSMNVVENLGVTHQVLRMQRDFQYDFHLAMQEHNRNITSRGDQLLAQMDAIRRFADFLYEGLRSIRISRQRALESPTSASVTTLPVHSGEARSEHMHEIIIQALEAAFRGDRHATLFCFILFAAGYLNLGSSIHINVSTTQFVFLLLALWKSLFWIQRSIPTSVKYNRSNLVTFVDLLGTQIHLSMELCLTSDTLHKILRAHFEDKKCRWFVENRRYELTKSDSDFAITQETWKSVVICGAEIMMNAILSKQSSQPIQSVICPSCETDSTEHSSELAAWVTCRTCYHQFKMSHARSGAPLVSSQNAQTSTRLDGSASVHPSTQFGASTNGRPDAPVIPPTIYLEPLSPMPVDDLKYCRRTRIDTVLENSTLNNGNNSRLHATTVPRWRSVDSALSDPSSDSSGSWMDLVSRSWLSHPPFGFSLHQLLDGEFGSEHLIADLSAYLPSLRHQGRPVSQIDRQSPATVPELRNVRIVCDLIPQWPIDVTLDGTSVTPFRPNRAAIDYITVEDILCSIHSDLHRQITHRDWNELAPAQEIEVARAYTRRYGADLQREKEIRSAGVKRIDFLGERIFFCGLTQLAPEDGIERLQLIVDHRDEASRDS